MKDILVDVINKRWVVWLALRLHPEGKKYIDEFIGYGEEFDEAVVSAAIVMGVDYERRQL